MRQIFILCVALASGPCSLGQGIFIFNNRLLLGPQGSYDAPVTDESGQGLGGPGWSAQMIEFRPDGTELALLPITTFRLLPRPAGFVFAETVQVPDVPPGGSLIVGMRVWQTEAGSWENSVIRGESNHFLVENLGSPIPIGPLAPPDLSGLQPFSVLPIVKITGQQATNSFKLEVRTGFLDRPLVVQSSMDLVSWFNVATNVPSTNQFQIQEPLSKEVAARWYRVLVPDN